MKTPAEALHLSQHKECTTAGTLRQTTPPPPPSLRASLLPPQLASSCACEWHFMFIVHCVLCSCLCENAHLHLVERGKQGAGTAGGRRGGSQPCCNADLFWRCTSCSFFAPTNDLPCLHHQRRTVAFSLLLCAFPSSYHPFPSTFPCTTLTGFRWQVN